MEFEIVKLFYPNEWRKNISELGVNPGVFNWFLCSKRVYDNDTHLFYISVSPDIQFYNEKTGETSLARGLKTEGGLTIPSNLKEKTGDTPIPSTSKKEKLETRRAKLLILSDPHNKKVLCKKYKVMCGCDSDRDILSTECDLVVNTKLLLNGASTAIKLGFDGAVVKHDCVKKCLDCVDNPICENATFLFLKNKKILEPVSTPERCGIIKYARAHNECIRKKVPEFPTVEEIKIKIQEEDCKKVSMELYSLMLKYISLKS